MARTRRSSADVEKGDAPGRKRRPPSGKNPVSPHPPEPEKGDPSLRLDVYVIDSGWESLPHRVLSRSIKMMQRYLSAHNLYILSPEQSVEFLKNHPHLMGRDPLLAVVDPQARRQDSKSGFGASVALGRFSWVLGRPENPAPDEAKLQAMIKMFLRIVTCHDGTKSIADEFRRFNHKEGTRGTLEIVMDSLGQEAFHLGEA
jgi:hypothetical protein